MGFNSGFKGLNVGVSASRVQRWASNDRQVASNQLNTSKPPINY